MFLKHPSIPPHLIVHHNARLCQPQPDARIIVIVVKRHQQTLERLLRPLQVQHGDAQIVQDFRPLGGAQALHRQFGVAGALLDGGRRFLVEGERVLEEAHGHCVVAHMEVHDAHVVGDDGVVVFALFPVRGGESY